MLKAQVFITLKAGVLDPKGATAGRALHSLGFTEVSQVRMGKYLEIMLEAPDAATARERLQSMCERLLANTVIENYRIGAIDPVERPS